MNMQTLKKRGTLGAVLSLLLGGLVLTPSPALAQAHFATVTAWEVQEFLIFKTGDDEDSIVRRLANATLVGQGTDGLCTLATIPGSAPQNPCALDGHAQSSVDLSTGQGPISGTFDILLDMNPGSPLLMDLVLRAKVQLKGTLNLGPALLFATTGGGAPVAFVSGTWKSRELQARGALTGTFLIPIPAVGPFAGCGMGWVYFNPLVSPMLVECLTLKDFSLGAPVVKVTAELTRSQENDTDD